MLLSAILRAVGLTLLSAAFSSATFIFGSGPLLALRRSFGRNYFVVCVMVTTLIFGAIGWAPVWLPFAIQAALVFVFCEIEGLGGSTRRSGFLALTTVSGVIVVAAVYYAKLEGTSIIEMTRLQVDELLQQVTAANPTLKLDTNTVVRQFPSLFFGLLATTLWMGLLTEKGFLQWFNISSGAKTERSDEVGERGPNHRALSDFRLPDSLIWVTIAATACAFVESGVSKVQLVGINFFNVLALFYFFQGLAVVAAFFKSYRFSKFWRAVGYTLAVLQLFLIVSLLGLLDFWFDFRRRMEKKSSAETI